MKKIAVIGANINSLPYYRRAKKLGYTIYGFAWAEGAVCKEYCDRFFPVSFQEKDKIAELCRELEVDGITSFSLESALPAVNYIAGKLGLEGNPDECMALIENKYTMRDCLAKSGVGIPGYRLVTDKNELKELRLAFPLVVKPVDNGGKRGVTRVESPEMLEKAIDYALEYSSSHQALVEEYIEGREFSVEYISYEGVHYFIAITDKVTSGPPHFVELEHHQPACLTAEEEAGIKELVDRTLTSLKIRSGASHTELKMNADGELFIIEVGPRMGGDFITPDLVKLSTGYDFTEGVIRLATGDFTPPVLKKEGYAGVYFLSGQTAEVRKYIDSPGAYDEIVDSELYKPEVTYAEKNSDRAGHFIYRSDKAKFELE